MQFDLLFDEVAETYSGSIVNNLYPIIGTIKNWVEWTSWVNIHFFSWGFEFGHGKDFDFFAF